MGIRYFARPVPPGLVAIAQINPGAFLDDANFWRVWEPSPWCPATLLLDKAWRDMQDLFDPNGQDPPRPAFELVRGQIRCFGLDIHPFDRVLDPAQVASIASDLAQADIRKLYQDCLPQHSPDWAAIMDGRRDRVTHYVAEAAYFTAELAASRMGLIYSIG